MGIIGLKALFFILHKTNTIYRAIIFTRAVEFPFETLKQKSNIHKPHRKLKTKSSKVEKFIKPT